MLDDVGIILPGSVNFSNSTPASIYHNEFDMHHNGADSYSSKAVLHSHAHCLADGVADSKRGRFRY